MKRLAILLAFLSMPAHPEQLLLVDKVAVTYCGGMWTADRVYHWPCVVYRNGFDGTKLPNKH